MQNSDPRVAAFDALIKQALAASQQNDTDTALRLLLDASKQLPQSGIPHFLIGAEYAQLGRMEEAESAYANAVLLAPSLTTARYQLGLVQFTSGRAALALVTWQPLLALPNNDPLGLFVQGFAELAQDNFESSLDHFLKGIEANKTNAPLNADITLVIEKIRNIINKQKSPQPPAPEDTANGTNEESSHFLLESYRQQKPLH